MLVVMKHRASEEQIEAVVATIKEMGYAARYHSCRSSRIPAMARVCAPK
jgi:hypothetical protein